LGNSSDDNERVRSAVATLDALQQVVAAADALRGRRTTLVFISEGMDLDVNAAKTPLEIRKGFGAVIDAANRATLSIYALYPRGVSQGGESATQLTGTGASQTGLQDEARWSLDGLQALAEGTSGRAFLRPKDLADALASIDADSRGYYLLTYASPAPDDDKFHSIEVRVNIPNLHVRARNGYVRTARPVVR
jgi:VWFA-related protein